MSSRAWNDLLELFRSFLFIYFTLFTIYIYITVECFGDGSFQFTIVCRQQCHVLLQQMQKKKGGEEEKSGSCRHAKLIRDDNKKLYFSSMIKVSGCIFSRVTKGSRQGVNAVLCVGIGNEGADNAETVSASNTKKKNRKNTNKRHRSLSPCTQHTHTQLATIIHVCKTGNEQLTRQVEVKDQGKVPKWLVGTCHLVSRMALL